MKPNSNLSLLKVHFRTVVEATSGAIRGVVDPIESSAVYAIIGTDSLSTFTDEDSGEYLFRGVEEGVYDVLVQPNEASGFDEVKITGVSVIVGSVTEMDTVRLQ